MKRLAGLSALALIISNTSGCGWLWGDEGYFRDRSTDYLEARRTAPMQTPPNVDAKRLDPLLPIPAHVADSTATPQEFEVPRPQALGATGEASEFSLQKSGDSRWLVAQRAPSEVWPVARSYFENSGFRVAEERPQTGEFITEWQGTKDLAPSMGRRLGSLMSDSDNQVRVRVRIEPGVVRNTSEVFVVSAEREEGSTADAAFPARTGNASLEASLLDGMLADLSSTAEHGSVSLLAARNYDAPNRVNLSQDGAGNPVLNLSTDFDRAWSSIGRALELGNVRVDDINRSLGVYYVNLAEGASNPKEEKGFISGLFSSEPSQEEIDARAERYQVRLTSNAGGDIQVTVEKDINTAAPEDVARRVLTLIQQNLG
ncbi:outer membrane protein assembly factor BamC [Pseudomonas sp. PDM16]|uniref:outer membrane protein assembly factor BamC n=1 Tax=Pseudomonas sp. PDM16 TaxID=2769292 RepID=UPI001781E136|nr:outer membrane protein assembly factor BamC [Pseudomonas sp. PDM16]MBD9414874.1 outer membrane protein assembly factor BamC [Pseudomonas sp. PDM16]